MNKDLAFYYLADKPQYLTTIASWYFKQWCEHSGRYSLQEVKQKLEKALNQHCLPMSVIALRGDELVGVAELKFHEMDAYLEFEHWLGGVFVSPSARGENIAKHLVIHLIDQAKRLDIKALYLQTESLGGGLYRKLGFEPLFITDSKGVRVLVMKKEL
ncbi:GNAT family N-acetyltransferase [Pseudoalteromonas luteoviolacea]|uniref:N-acetyltransferase domain-containing protein n=1 Tax=Pseudoalteromonas luteoviolacea S4060-1 TaxID=1365257 RepID=A0A162CFI7_9GAMM|nr:GNAT family N-acetyltransferase [Pseudoalteromonas luteoviolacea]KZN36973.1 hypothetical protein N480_17060 [Pseudoalteromonas luteoviolacea S2607]KZN67106.1 hypothetical protein N478_20000 [Pseudoalteromonas luteoviolacea S4060-1]